MYDNPCQSAQLNSILSIGKLDAVAFVPEPFGSEYADHAHGCWIPYYERIQKSGKKLIFTEVRPESAVKLLEILSPSGVYIQTACANEDEARELLAIAGKYF